MGKEKDRRLDSSKSSFSRGEWHSQISDEYFFPEMTRGLSACERSMLLRFTRCTFGSRERPQLTLIVQASVTYLMKHEPYKRSAVKKALKGLGQKRLVRQLKSDHKHGNSYFVEPAYLWSDKWHLFDGIDRSYLARELVGKRLTCIESIPGWSENDQQSVGKQPICAALPGTELVGKRPQYRSRSSDPTAHRVSSPITTEGGVADPGQEVSFGQITTPPGPPKGGEKGVAPSGDLDLRRRKKRHSLVAKLALKVLAGTLSDERYHARIRAFDEATERLRSKKRPQKEVGKGRGEQVSSQPQTLEVGGQRS